MNPEELLDRTLFSVGQTPITPATLAMVVFVAFGTLGASKGIQRLLGRLSPVVGPGRQASLQTTQRLAHYLILALGFGVALDLLGIDLRALFTAGAIFAVVFGLAMQNIAQNFVSGVIMLLEHTVKPGDVLEVDGRLVKVVDMGIRSTIANTLDEEEIVLPNSVIVQSTVKNYTLKSSIYRLRASVGVTYDSDMAKVRRCLERVGAEQEWRNRTKAPLVLMLEFGDSAVVYEVSVWIDDPWMMRRAKSDLNEAIWAAFKEEGITIAFPQLDVHLDRAALEAVSAGCPRAGE